MNTLYEVIRRPIITEKSNFQNSKLQQYTFEVLPEASKQQIKDAVEKLFDVTVLKVNVVNMPPKRTRNLRTRQTAQRRGKYKKAIVTLASGETIQVFEGVK